MLKVTIHIDLYYAHSAPQLNLFRPSITVVGNSDLINSCGPTVESLRLYDLSSQIAENYIIPIPRLKCLCFENRDFVSNTVESLILAAVSHLPHGKSLISFVC